MSREPTEPQFLNDVGSHQMIVLHEDGIYRHIRFKRPDSGIMHFDLVTYPGHLVYSGDMGCYVFNRLDDMFQFFRPDARSDELQINLGYWSEKLQAVDGRRDSGSATEFCGEKLDRVVRSDLIRWIRNNFHRTTKEERRELWDTVEREVIYAEADGGGYRKQVAAHDFYHQVNERVGGFSFVDLWDHSFTEFTYRFVWCCYAIAWGIRKYDQSHGPQS